MGIVTIIIIVITSIFSYRGITKPDFFAAYVFEVDKIRINRDYKRFFTAGLLHLDWLHLIFNMLTLVFAGPFFEATYGPLEFLLVYIVGLAGGNLLAYLMRRNDSGYSAAGASGATSGVLFALIALIPQFSLSIFLLPMPGWLYGLLFVLFSIYGIRNRAGGIAHEAHLGGALLGMACALLLHPSSLLINYIPILIVAVPALVFLILIFKKPHLLLINKPFSKKKAVFLTVDDKDNMQKLTTQEEVDRILEKIHNKGIHSLTPKEKKLLEEYSKKSF
jgi:membrane associated rhomboid family serine protease